MKAVNLLPSEDRPSSSRAGRSDGLVYVLLGVLALLALMAAGYGVASRNVNQRRGELSKVQAQAQEARNQANRLSAYTSFSDMRKRREQTIRQIVTNRFDWAHAMHDVARVIPKDIWLSSVTGTVNPTVQIDGGGNGQALRSQLPVPALEIAGCARSQASVARMMVRLRLIDGARRVTLVSSDKPDDNGGSDSNSGGCATSPTEPQFDLLVFFRTPDQIQPPYVKAPAATVTPAATTTPAATVTPAATTTPAATPTPTP